MPEDKAWKLLRTGLATEQDGYICTAAAGSGAQLLTSALHGRLYEAGLRGQLFSGGAHISAGLASIHTNAQVGPTAQPIAGIWNPPNSGVMAVIWQVWIQGYMLALTATGAATMVWNVSRGNGAISTGKDPLNRSTLLPFGSKVKDMSNVACTGLTNNFAAVPGVTGVTSPTSVYDISTIGTATGFQIGAKLSPDYSVNGGMIVMPGVIVGLFNTRNTANTTAVASGIVWEEIAL